MKRFLIITNWSNPYLIVEAEDISEAVEQGFDTHTKFDHILAVIELPDEV